jgi:TolB-like protein
MKVSHSISSIFIYNLFQMISPSISTIQIMCQLRTYKKKLFGWNGITKYILVLLIVFVIGCSKRYNDLPVYSPIPLVEYTNESVGRFKSSFLAEQIDEYYEGVDPGPIGVTTLVNLDDLYRSSTFGRLYAEQLMSELTMRGFEVVELRHSDAIQFLERDGEFALSRNSFSVRPMRELGGLVVGTYASSQDRVYVNVRLIEPSTSRIVSAGSVEMSKTTELARLLKRGGGGGSSGTGTLERIPIRRLGYTMYPHFSDDSVDPLERGDDKGLPPTNLPAQIPRIIKR